MKNMLARISELYLKYGIKSVSMDDVSRELGISKKTLYQHFKDKDELVKKVIRMHMEHVASEMRKIESQNVNAIEELFMVSKFITQYLKQLNPSVTYDLQKYYPDIWKSIYLNQREHVYEQVKENMVKGMKQGLYRSDLNIEVIAHFYLYRIEMANTIDLVVEHKYSYEEIFNTSFNYHVRGIANAKGIEFLEKKLKSLT